MFEGLFAKQGLSMDRLRNFLLVVESGSIAQAADRDPSRQSLLSRQIRELEEFFGAELTRRAGKGIVFTEEGLELARIARVCFTGLEDYLLRQVSKRPLFRVGAGFSTMQWLITPKSKALSDGLGVELEMVRMRSRDAAGLLRSGEIDLAVVRADAVDVKDERLEVFELGSSGYSLFGSAKDALPLAVPTGGGQFEMALNKALADGEPERIHCGSLLQMASLVVDEQARAVLPDIAANGFRRMNWVKRKGFPKLKDYRRHWVLAASKRQMEARGVSLKQLECSATLLKIG